jgi:hypothetical protein
MKKEERKCRLFMYAGRRVARGHLCRFLNDDRWCFQTQLDSKAMIESHLSATFNDGSQILPTRFFFLLISTILKVI